MLYPFDGMGHVTLNKNMQNIGTDDNPEYINMLNQEMLCKYDSNNTLVPNTNTIFLIDYDFILIENITIPDDCILIFNGGTISGPFTIFGSTFSLVGNGHQVGSVCQIKSISGVFKCFDCKFDYNADGGSNYFIDCRGGCEIRGNEFVGFKSNVINLEDCAGECIVTGNYIHDSNLLNPTSPERRAIHILHCGNVDIRNNVIDKYVGTAIGFVNGNNAEIFKSVVVADNTIRNTKEGGITSMGGILKNAVIKNNSFYNVNDGSGNDYSGHGAVINIHGVQNCVVEGNTVRDCQGLGVDVDGAYYENDNNSCVVRNNVFDGCRRLAFTLCDDIVFSGNKVSNIIPNSETPGAIRLRKPLRFTMQGHDCPVKVG